jgi:hypothetical protein
MRYLLMIIVMVISACGTDEVAKPTQSISESDFIQSNKTLFEKLIENCDKCKLEYATRHSAFEFKKTLGVFGTCQKFEQEGRTFSYNITINPSLLNESIQVQQWVFLHEMSHCVLDETHPATSSGDLMDEYTATDEIITNLGGIDVIFEKVLNRNNR